MSRTPLTARTPLSNWQVFISRQGWHIGRILDTGFEKKETYFKTLAEASRELENIKDAD